MKADKHLLPSGSSIKQALEKLNDLGNFLTLFVIDADRKVLGTITDGDIRRAILKGISVDHSVEPVMNTKFTALQADTYSFEDIRKIRERLIKLVPVVDSVGRILRLLNLEKVKTILPLDAVVMAGGEGRRLRPMTEHTPKPLLKIGTKPIIEYNIERLAEYGVENCYITIKYLGEQIRDYFRDGEKYDMHIGYVEETGEPLGTIGSVALINEFKHDCVLVMNSDLLTNIDYEDFYLEFEKSDAAMAVATIPYQVKIPYAVLETNKELITGFKEKPTYTYYSNGGIYLIKKQALSIIPKGKHYNATDLMDYLISAKQKVITYPLYCYWLDIGKPEDFQKAQEDIHHIKF
ncbi:MAG TPA: nucleotidyltransferase family protein [Chryseosolibacter sp.]